MKRTFRSYYRPTNDEFRALWETATFVPDANVLLNVYRYSPSARDELLEMLEKIKDRLWIPYQFALEFHKNRAKVILEQVINYENIRKQLTEILENQFKSLRKHPFITDSSLKKFEKLCSELERSQKEHEKLVSNDPLLEKLSAIFEGRAGQVPSDEDSKAAHDKARSRFALDMPPGYKDKGKGEPGCFGDCIGWLQILDFSKEKGVPIILITDDKKEDWWQIEFGRHLGPRQELIEEYYVISKKGFYMYSLSQFMEHANDRLGQAITRETLEEAKQRSEINEKVRKDVDLKPMEVPDARLRPSLDDEVPKDTPKGE